MKRFAFKEPRRVAVMTHEKVYDTKKPQPLTNIEGLRLGLVYVTVMTI